MQNDYDLELIICRIEESTTISQLERILEQIVEIYFALYITYTLVSPWDFDQSFRRRLRLVAGQGLHEIPGQSPYQRSDVRRGPPHVPPFLPQVREVGKVVLVHFSVNRFQDQYGDIQMAWRQDIAQCPRGLRRHIRDIVMISMHLHDAILRVVSQSTSPRERSLPRREAECLYLASTGLQGREIAEELQISEAAVRLYLTHARRRLSAKNTTHAVARALIKGLMRKPNLTVRLGQKR